MRTAYDTDAALARVAARQYGTLSRADVRDAGGDDPFIRRRVLGGLWRRVAPGVYVHSGYDDCFEQRLWILWHAAGHGAQVTMQSAGAQLGLLGIPRHRLVVTVEHGQHQEHPWGTIRQTRRPWPRSNIVIVDGLPTTDAAATIVDLAGQLHTTHLFNLVDDANKNGCVPLGAVSRAFAFADYPARPGRIRLAKVLDELAPGAGIHGSILERIFHETVERLGFEPWTPQMAFPGRELPGCAADAGDEPSLTIVEADGRKWHARNQDRRRDIHRDRVAARAGYHVERILGEELLRDPATVVTEVEHIRRTRRAQLAHLMRT